MKHDVSVTIIVMRRASSPSCHIRTTPSNYENHVVLGEGYELMIVFEHQARGVTHLRVFLMLVSVFWS